MRSTITAVYVIVSCDHSIMPFVIVRDVIYFVQFTYLGWSVVVSWPQKQTISGCSSSTGSADEGGTRRRWRQWWRKRLRCSKVEKKSSHAQTYVIANWSDAV